MKKFKYFGAAIILSIAIFLTGYLLSEHTTNTGPKIPDEGLEYLIVVPLAILMLILGLALDLYFMLNNSNKPLINNRKPFWQIIGIIGILGLFLMIFRAIAF
jgi:UDP-N-acetylmuramyl pentapeptide phosphotransferase/UDP-N-acetylglucosamine-1-phosphate transferase